MCVSYLSCTLVVMLYVFGFILWISIYVFQLLLSSVVFAGGFLLSHLLVCVLVALFHCLFVCFPVKMLWLVYLSLRWNDIYVVSACAVCLSITQCCNVCLPPCFTCIRKVFASRSLLFFYSFLCNLNMIPNLNAFVIEDYVCHHELISW